MELLKQKPNDHLSPMCYWRANWSEGKITLDSLEGFFILKFLYHKPKWRNENQRKNFKSPGRKNMNHLFPFKMRTVEYNEAKEQKWNRSKKEGHRIFKKEYYIKKELNNSKKAKKWYSVFNIPTLVLFIQKLSHSCISLEKNLKLFCPWVVKR